MSVGQSARAGRLPVLGLLVLLGAAGVGGPMGCGACEERSPAEAAGPGMGVSPPSAPGRAAQWPPPPDDSDLPVLSERGPDHPTPGSAPRPAALPARRAGKAGAPPPGSGAETRLWSQLTDPDPAVREHVLERLSGRRDPHSLELLEEYLAREADPDLKARALELLEEAGPRAASAIGRALSDPSPEVREQAAEALESVGGPESVALLWAAHGRESDPDVAETILDALEVLGEDVDAYREP